MKARGTARKPSYDSRSLPPELVAAGYEANGMDTDYSATHWTDPALSDARDSAERIFEVECTAYQDDQVRWFDRNDGTARWAAEVVFEPAEGETNSGVWFSRAQHEPDPEDVYTSGFVLPGLDADAILEVTIRMAPGHPDWTPVDYKSDD